jgi:hypothetical protein
MGLSNGASQARNYTQTNNQPQGGGEKKAGLRSTVGKGYLTNIYYHRGTANSCCTLAKLQLTANPTVCVSRPIGGNVQFNTYFQCPLAR